MIEEHTYLGQCRVWNAGDAHRSYCPSSFVGIEDQVLGQKLEDRGPPSDSDWSLLCRVGKLTPRTWP